MVQHTDSGRGLAREPHLPYARLPDGTWVYAPPGVMLVVAGGSRVVCHACGAGLAAVSAAHARTHNLALSEYRQQFGSNAKASLSAPALRERRRAEGQRRWEENAGVRDGLARGPAMARSGQLYELGAAAQERGTRRLQGRRTASRAGASPALRADRRRRSSRAHARWTLRASDLGFADLDSYLAVRRAQGVTAHQVRVELGCGGSVAARLLSATTLSGLDENTPTEGPAPGSVSTDVSKPAHAGAPVGSVTGPDDTAGAGAGAGAAVGGPSDLAPGRQE